MKRKIQDYEDMKTECFERGDPFLFHTPSPFSLRLIPIINAGDELVSLSKKFTELKVTHEEANDKISNLDKRREDLTAQLVQLKSEKVSPDPAAANAY